MTYWALYASFYKLKMEYEIALCLEYGVLLFFFQAEDGIRDHCVTGVQTCALPICFDGWEIDEIEQRKFIRSDDGKVSRDKKLPKNTIQRPTYENGNLRNIIFDPGCTNQDPNSGQWIAKRIQITAYDLDAMREDDTYKNIPTREQLAEILAFKQEPTTDSMQALKPNQTREYQAIDDKIPTSKDPLLAPLELVEYRRRDRVITA